MANFVVYFVKILISSVLAYMHKLEYNKTYSEYHYFMTLYMIWGHDSQHYCGLLQQWAQALLLSNS